MTITINEEICNNNNLTFSEALVLLAIKSGNLQETIDSLLKKEAIILDIYNEYLITQRWEDILSNIILKSDKIKQPDTRIEDLTQKLMNIFPKAKKVGTCHYFRGNSKDISLRLRKFFKLYGSKYSDEQILNAATQYVKSFNGDYTYMRILKYFIWKDEKKLNQNGELYIEETSDLASYIENEGQEDSIENDWTSTLR